MASTFSEGNKKKNLYLSTKNEASTTTRKKQNKSVSCDLKHVLYDEGAVSFNSCSGIQPLKQHLLPPLLHNKPVTTTHSNFLILQSSGNCRSHEGDNDDYCLLACDAVYPSRSVQMFQRGSFSQSTWHMKYCIPRENGDFSLS